MESGKRNFYQEALHALKTSTRLLTVAEGLLKVGNFNEADRLRVEAKRQRNISVRLIEKANIEELSHELQIAAQARSRASQLRLGHQKRH